MLALAGIAMLGVVRLGWGGEDQVSSPPSRWLWLVPGGGQFWLGETNEGIAYAAGVGGLAGWGVYAETRRDGGEINAPLVCAQQLYVVSFYSARRDLLLRAAQTDRLDPSRVSTLATAPFQPNVLASPWVIGFVGAGVAINWIGAVTAPKRKSWKAMRSISYLGDDFGRDAGTAAAGGYWLSLSYGAGEAEEMLFRGTLQADWEGQWGPAWGWLAASGVFGLAHLTSIKSSDSWEHAGFAALAGLWLGWRCQRNGYRLSEDIASHAWFDIMAGVVAFALDPADNPLGAKVSFGF